MSNQSQSTPSHHPETFSTSILQEWRGSTPESSRACQRLGQDSGTQQPGDPHFVTDRPLTNRAIRLGKGYVVRPMRAKGLALLMSKRPNLHL